MTDSITAYIRTAGIQAAIPNAALNPAIALAINYRERIVPLSGIVVDTAITALVLSFIVTMFVAAALRRDLKAGRLELPEELPFANSLLAWLPASPWALGLSIGAALALLLAPVTFGLYQLCSVAGLPLTEFALVKAAYTPLLGYLVARWVIMRQLLLAKR
jgi:hypothetical protein